MNDQTHFAPLEIILPHIDDDKDQCVERLQQLLENEKHFDKVHLTRKNDKTGVCIHYNPDNVNLDNIKSLVTLTGAKISDQYIHETLHIDGMDCADCTKIIEHALEHVDGVMAAKVGYASQQLRIEYDRKIVKLKDIKKRLKHLGFTARLKKPPKNWWHENGELTLSLTAGFFLMCGWLANSFIPMLSFPAYLISIGFSGLMTFRHSLQTLMQKRFDIDVLMVFAAIGAMALGEFFDAALLLFLFSFGHSLEHRAMHHAQDAVNSLAKLAPKNALIIRDGQELNINVEDLNLNDEVIVKPGERIPADGLVIDGVSSVDQSPITGESMPIDKKQHDKVFAGSINGEGLLRLCVTKTSQNSTINRMVRMVLEADTQKSPTQRFTDKFVKIFVPVVLLGVIALIFIPPIFGVNWSTAFYRAMAVLVAASPCALAISTPAAVLSGVARAAQRGVLIKGGAHLENLGSVNVIAFDKTGTLTLGKPKVESIIAMDSDENTLLSIAASLEKYSSHPLAKAVVAAAEQRNLPLIAVENVQQITGKGIVGQLNGKIIEVGAFKLFDSVPDNISKEAEALFANGQTIMLVKQDNQWLGIIGLADSVRPEVNSAIEKLHAQGIKNTVMLTGDNQRAANTIAKLTGIDTVHADLMPEDKLRLVSELESKYRPIAMVGDGINDAPALARASVGIAMGGAGTDAALEASDVSLMADDLSQLAFAVRLSRRAQLTIRQNLWISLGMVAVLLTLTATGLAGIGPAIIAHEGSTLFVVMNALRLLRFV